MADRTESELRHLKKVFTQEPDANYKTLEFGELTVGDRYIPIPIPGDNNGRGGFLRSAYIFQKIKPIEVVTHGEHPGTSLRNTIRLKDGDFSNNSDGMTVIRIE